MHIPSYRILSYHILPHSILSYLVVSYLVLSHVVMIRGRREAGGFALRPARQTAVRRRTVWQGTRHLARVAWQTHIMRGSEALIKLQLSSVQCRAKGMNALPPCEGVIAHMCDECVCVCARVCSRARVCV